MIGLNKIIEKIIEEARVEAREITEEANVRCIAISNSYADRAEARRAELKAAADKEAEEIVFRTKSIAASERRNALDGAKAEMVNEAFAAAEKEIKSLSSEKYRELLVMILTSTFIAELESERENRRLYGSEEFEEVEKYEVLLNRNDRDIHGERLLEGVRRAVVGKIDAETLSKLVLSDRVVNIDGGLILVVGNTELNCSLPALFAAVREKLEKRVYDILFNEE